MAARGIRVYVLWGIFVFFSVKTVSFARQGSDRELTSISVPRVMTLNGILTERNGHALSGVVGIRLALYRDQSGGSPLWTEIQNAQLDSQGRFTLFLGQGMPADLFNSAEPH